ncbi:MAG: DNA-binding protein [Dehalococcoidia bacterium]
MMTKTQMSPWDLADHIQSEEDVIAYLEAALEDGDPALVATVLDDIARAMIKNQILRASDRR